MHPTLSSSVMADLAAKAEIEFHILELTHETMTPENIFKTEKNIHGFKWTSDSILCIGHKVQRYLGFRGSNDWN